MGGGNVGYDPTYGDGWLPYVNTEGRDPTYSVFLSQVAPVAGVFLVLPAPTNDRWMKITRVEAGPSVATAAGAQVIKAQIANTPFTGGTTTPVTVNQNDSLDPASTVVPVQYTAAPAGGGAVISTVRDGQLISAAVSTAIGGNVLVWDFGNRPARCPTIRPVAGNLQSFVLRANAALAGQLVDLYVEWIERPLA